MSVGEMQTARQQSARRRPNVICSFLIMLHVCIRPGVLPLTPTYIEFARPAVAGLHSFYRPTGHLTLLMLLLVVMPAGRGEGVITQHRIRAADVIRSATVACVMLR